MTKRYSGFDQSDQIAILHITELICRQHRFAICNLSAEALHPEVSKIARGDEMRRESLTRSRRVRRRDNAISHRPHIGSTRGEGRTCIEDVDIALPVKALVLQHSPCRNRGVMR